MSANDLRRAGPSATRRARPPEDRKPLALPCRPTLLPRRKPALPSLVLIRPREEQNPVEGVQGEAVVPHAGISAEADPSVCSGAFPPRQLRTSGLRVAGGEVTPRGEN